MDLHELAVTLRSARWDWALLSAALAPIGLLPRAWRWRYLFPPDEAPRGLTAATMIGYMANNLLPLRAGELVRVSIVTRRQRGGFWLVFATLVVERVLDSAAIILILGSLALLMPVPPIFRGTAIALMVVDAAAIALLVALAAAPQRFQALLSWALGRWPRIQQRAVAAVTTFARGLEGVRSVAHTVPLFCLTILVWVCPVLAAWTMLRALGLDLPWLAGWTVLAFVGLSVSIPSAPGYIGVYHYAAALAVSLFGVSKTPATAFALLSHAAAIVPVTLVGWIYLLREHMTLGEARHAVPIETPPP